MTKTDRKATFVRLGLIAGASGLAMAMAAPAFADDTPAAPPSTGTAAAEIIVTAQFRAQKLQDTPISITAINSKLLESRNETDLSQITAQAPNVQLTQMGAAFGSSMAVYIRGVGQYDFNPAYEPGVGLYVDDVYYATLTGSVLDLLDLDRVEVLRGPQGTLAGRNSEGGAIKLYSVKPNATDSGTIEMAYGSRNRVDLRATANFKLTDNLFVRVAGVYKRQDGYVDQVDYGCAHPGNSLGLTANPSTPANCVVGKLGGRNYAGTRATLRYTPNDKLDWMVIGDYTYENRPNAAGVLTVDDTTKTDGLNFMCGPKCTYASFYMLPGGQVTQGYSMPNNTMFTGWGVSSNLKYTFNDSLNFQSITAYRKYQETFGTDDDYTPDPNIAGAGYNDLRFHFFSEEARLNGKFGTLLDWTVGGYYNSQKTVYFTRQDIRYIGHGLDFLDLQFEGNDPVNAHSAAAFGTVTVHPTSALNITGGIRYTKEHKDYTFVRKNLSGGTLTDIFGVGLLDGTVANYDGSKVDWRISADYRFSPQLMAYATASTGFKGGGVTARPFTKAQATNGTFKPETLTAYELGLKSDLLDRRLRIDVSAFYNNYKNIQLPLADCSVLDGFKPGNDPFPCAAVGNAGDGHMYGAEGEVTATPLPGLDFDGSISYITGKWTSISSEVGGSIQLGDPITTPNWKASAGVQYKADLGDNGSVTPRFDIAYTGKQNFGRLSATAPLDFDPAYAIGNARITWKNPKGDLAISMEVQNVFNKYYYLPLRFSALYASAGTVYSTVGRPREWALTVRKTF